MALGWRRSARSPSRPPREARHRHEFGAGLDRFTPWLRHDAVHWSAVGAVDAPDDVILFWARAENWIVLTSDLDFGTLLAISGATKPSVVQLRTGTTLSSRICSLVARVLHETEADLLSGALVTIEDERVRLRPLIFDVKQ